MRFYKRAFLFSFVPFALLLLLSFLLVQRHVQSTVREGLRHTLRQNQENLTQLRDANELRNRLALTGALADTDLLSSAKESITAALTPLTATPQTTDQRATQTAADTPENGVQAGLQDQILQLGSHFGEDLVVVTRTDRTPVAGVARAGGGSAELVPLYVFPQMEMEKDELLVFRGEAFQTKTASLVMNGQELGYLTVGVRLNLSLFTTPSVLLHGARALYSNIGGASLLDIGTALSRCTHGGECEAYLKGHEWMSLPVLRSSEASGWTLYSLADVDQATAQVSATLRHIFLYVILISLVTTLIFSFLGSRAIVSPIETLVSHLEHCSQSGALPVFQQELPNIFEVRKLAHTYNMAAGSVRNAQENLQSAYVEFVYSLANALDARDKYTAGHSKRVSEISCALASAMGQSASDIERLRVGALLHDIGKIGISDSVLQKPGKLSDEEFKIIKRHPVTGRHILQGVRGFAKYLPAVELHHENWDGTGYPKRQRGEETPLDARIIHVADAYDAMTTNRSYRAGMTHDRALTILVENAGTQFDPKVVSVLLTISTTLQRTVVSSEITSPVPYAPEQDSARSPMTFSEQESLAAAQQAAIADFIESQTISFADRSGQHGNIRPYSGFAGRLPWGKRLQQLRPGYAVMRNSVASWVRGRTGNSRNH
ncbi:MAG TPA: HD-GYP domain-containing protein [Acidobacteriaceae bacterium]